MLSQKLHMEISWFVYSYVSRNFVSMLSRLKNIDEFEHDKFVLKKKEFIKNGIVNQFIVERGYQESSKKKEIEKTILDYTDHVFETLSEHYFGEL